MSTLYTINVTNNSAFQQSFFFFQKPAVYVGGQLVYSNAIYQANLSPYATSGSILTFQFLQQFYAGAQTSVPNLHVGQASGYTTAAQPIDITPQSGTSNNTTSLNVNPLGLTVPVSTPGVQPGAYRIITPSFNPVVAPINAGLAISNQATGTFVLSNFIQAQPLNNIDCQPIVIFYVATGSYQAGQVINFSTSSVGAATCDATTGFTTFNVTYNIDGTWSVTPVSAASRTLFFPGLTQHIGSASPKELAAPTVPVDILNEAGTAVIATGQAANLNLPVTVNNVIPPGVLLVGREYQLRSGTTTVGVMCTAIHGNSATFA